MTSLRLMEWDPKPPLQWDWENLIMFNTTADNSRKLQSTGWEIDGDMAIQMGSFFSQGDGSCCNGGSGSDLVLVSLSKSSGSAASNSSSIGEVKSSKLTFESSEAVPDDFNTNNNGLASANPSGNSPTVESSVGSGEPFLGLKLGKRTYFKDSCAGDDTKPCAFSPIPASSISSSKRSKSSCHGGHARCQVEGCNLDLSSAKDYHRKHRVCESHSRCPKVIVAGMERRFCQQCSRFHGLSEFDGKKRSCRRRLSDHNARRRKPQPDSIQLIPATRSSLIYGESPQMSSSVWSRIPLSHARQNPNMTFDGISGSKYTAVGDCVFKNTKAVISDEQLHLPSNDLTAISLDQQDFKDLLPSKAKGTSSHNISQGVEEPLISSSGDTANDLHRALSLLSTNAWGSSACVPLEQPIYSNHSSLMHQQQQQQQQQQQHHHHQGLSLASPEFWRIEQQSPVSRIQALSSSHHDGCCNYFQEFQLLPSPYENDFYSGRLN